MYRSRFSMPIISIVGVSSYFRVSIHWRFSMPIISIVRVSLFLSSLSAMRFSMPIIRIVRVSLCIRVSLLCVSLCLSSVSFAFLYVFRVSYHLCRLRFSMSIIYIVCVSICFRVSLSSLFFHACHLYHSRFSIPFEFIYYLYDIFTTLVIPVSLLLAFTHCYIAYNQY